MMGASRSSGILLHPTSLPGRFGVGDLGSQAYRFVDFLAASGQTIWQILPLGPTGYGNSPYMSFSVFAGNPLLVSLEGIVAEGLLDASDIESPPCFSSDRVDFGGVLGYKMPLLLKSFHRFKAKCATKHTKECDRFYEENAYWLEDYALFMSLKEFYHKRAWTTWPEGVGRREPGITDGLRESLRDDIEFNKYVQYVFFKQWQALRSYCRGSGISIVGDLPIYAAHDSADVWAKREFFYLDDRGSPFVVAGVPPDYFSASGQRWGNPIYRWDVMGRNGYKWWIDRFRANFNLVDMIRIDHFRGFEAYWEIPAGEATAVNGAWKKGPGSALFEAAGAVLGDIKVIAEDLGVITPEVDALREKLGFPGMKVLQMAFGNDPKASEYRPHNHTRNSVVYTATHDHNTTLGWFTAEPGSQSTQTPEEVGRERTYALRYADSDGREINWDFIRLALGSVADMAVFPLQDVLGLGTEARMNLPGTARGNWEWRFRDGVLTDEIAGRLRELTRVYERGP